MELELIRDWPKATCTLGKLYKGQQFICYTVEDVIREEKVHGQTAIPAGIYPVVITFSQRFQKRLPLLLNVPNFEGIRIHSGNTVADTEGCILPGLTRTDNGVGDSRRAMDVLFPMLEQAIAAGEKVTIAVKNLA